MAKIALRAWQEEALSKMRNGCILFGGVGSGKSLTSLAYYNQENGGVITEAGLIPMIHPCDLYIITTAQKRDKLEWEKELSNFEMSIFPDQNKYDNKIVVDSWNNVKKYTDVKNAFFIFDEQRVVGYGTWTKSFLEIAKNNKWVLLTATPGDTWMDYLPIFIANGYFKNKSDFIRKHVIYSPYTIYPKVDRYINEARLLRYKREILIPMEFERETIQHHEYVVCDYDTEEYRYIRQRRWNIYKNKPIENAGEYCLCLRRCVNSSVDRQLKTLKIVEKHPKAIIFYSHDYELEILRNIFKNYTVAEWNGHKHEAIPVTEKWVYLVEYTAGCEGWNCLSTDTIIFYSQNYSYKVMTQAAGRIDRMNTPYKNLYYYHLKSKSDIDRAISTAIRVKKKFNERGFAPQFDNKVIENDKQGEEYGKTHRKYNFR